MFSDCVVNLSATILVFERADENEWAPPDCLGWLLYNFVNAMIISVLERQTKSLRKRVCGEPVQRIVQAKVPLVVLKNYVTPA